MKNKKLMNRLLAVVCGLGLGGALQAATYTQVFSQDFENATTYTENFHSGDVTNAIFGTGTGEHTGAPPGVATNAARTIYGTTDTSRFYSSDRAASCMANVATYQFNGTVKALAGYSLEFDYFNSPAVGSKAKDSGLSINGPSAVIATINYPGAGTKGGASAGGKIYRSDDSSSEIATYTTSERGYDPADDKYAQYWMHVKVTANDRGVRMSVVRADGTTTLSETSVSDTFIALDTLYFRIAYSANDTDAKRFGLDNVVVCSVTPTTYTWTGNAGDNVWTNAQNWTSTAVGASAFPVTGDTVLGLTDDVLKAMDVAVKLDGTTLVGTGSKSAYVWTDAAEDDHYWSTVGNWNYGIGVPAYETPTDKSTVTFPSTFTEGTEVLLKSHVCDSKNAGGAGAGMTFNVNCAVTLKSDSTTQYCINPRTINGTGTIALGCVEIRLYQGTCNYNVPMEILPSSDSDPWGTPVRFFTRAASTTMNFHGKITGSGCIAFAGDNSNNNKQYHNLYSDCSDFTGKFLFDVNNQVGGNSNRMRMRNGGDFGKATVEIVDRLSVNDLTEDTTVRIGSLNGAGVFCNENTYKCTLEVGGVAGGSFTGTFTKSADTTPDWAFLKVGTGTQTIGADAPFPTGTSVEVQAGELALVLAAESLVTCAAGTELGREDGTYAYYMHPVAQIGTVKYGSLALALAARQSGEAMTILDDCTLPSGATFDDLTVAEGATVTCSADEPLKVNGTLTASNLSLIATDIATTGTYTVVTASALTLSGTTTVTVTGACSTGATTIESGTIKVRAVPNVIDAAQWYRFNGSLEPEPDTQALTFEGGTNGATYVDNGDFAAGKALLLDMSSKVLPYAGNAAYDGAADAVWSIACVATTGTPREGAIWSMGDAGHEYRTALVCSKGRLSFVSIWKNGATGTELIGTDLESDNLTYHTFVMTHDADARLTLYVDGELKGSTVFAQELYNSKLGLGRTYPWSDGEESFFADGVRLADLRIFTRALTASQIAYYAEMNPQTSIEVTDKTFTWTGNAGDGLWSTPGNWKYAGAASGLVPGEGADVVLADYAEITMSLSEPLTLGSLAGDGVTLILNAEGAALKAGTVLTITGDKPTNLTVASNDDRYTFSYANGVVTAAYADTLYVWQGGSGAAWTAAANWLRNGSPATSAPAATDNVLIDQAVTIDTTGDCYGSNITVCASVTLAGAGPLRFAEIDGGEGAGLSLDGTELRINTPSRMDAHVNVPIEIAAGRTAKFTSGAKDSYVHLIFTRPITGGGDLTITYASNRSVHSGVRLEGDMSSFSGSVTYELQSDSQGNSTRLNDQLKSCATSASARWNFYTNPAKDYDFSDKVTLFADANSCYRFGSLKMRLPADNQSLIAADGVTMQVGALDEDSWISGDWGSSANAPTLEWVAPTATFTNMTEQLGTLVLSGGGTVMLPATNCLPTAAITFSGNGGLLDFGSNVYSTRRQNLRLLITNSTAQVAINLGSDKDFQYSAFLDSSNVGGYRKTSSNTIGFNLRYGAGYSGLTTVAEGKLKLPQGIVLDGGLEVLAGAKVIVTNVTSRALGDTFLTWKAEGSSVTTNDFVFTSTLPAKYALGIVTDAAEGVQRLQVVPNSDVPYTWSDSGDHLWNNVANWTVNGQPATSLPEDGFNVVIPGGSTIVLPLDCDFSSLGTVTLGSAVTIVVQFTDANQTYAIPVAIRGAKTITGCGPFNNYAKSATTLTSGSRVASTFTWCGGGASSEWHAANNWKVGDYIVAVYPSLNDEVVFPANASGWRVSVQGDNANSANMTFNADVTFTGDVKTAYTYDGNGASGLNGRMLTFGSASGSGKATLVDVCVYTGSSPANMNCDFEVPQDSVSGIYCNNITMSVNGRLSGAGQILVYQAGVNNGVTIDSDCSDFTGSITVKVVRNYERSRFQLDSGAASLRHATIDDQQGYQESKNASYLLGTAGETYYVGGFNGHLAIWQSKPTLVIGGANRDCTAFGMFARGIKDANNHWESTLIKEGTARLTMNSTQLCYVRIQDGELNLANAAPMYDASLNPYITFEGGALACTADATGAVFDPSSYIVNSTSAVCFNTDGADRTWATAVDASNVGGFTKRGDGTLTLAVQPLYTGPTCVEGGCLAVEGTLNLEAGSKITVSDPDAAYRMGIPFLQADAITGVRPEFEALGKTGKYYILTQSVIGGKVSYVIGRKVGFAVLFP